MKNIRIKIINFMLLFSIISQIIVPFNISNSSNSEDEEIYDVILFWGQSNMVGYCGTKDNEKQADTRYNSSDLNSIKSFSNKTGIDKEILANSVRMNYTKVKQESDTAYEYKYTTNSLEKLTEGTQALGEKLVYNSTTKKLEDATSKYSIQKSYGTNMIPQFSQTYYKKTGHKVVAVFAANGGEAIENFLPSTDAEYGDNNKQMIYESMVEKYKLAIKYMEKNGYKIGNKIWVCFQGESNVGKGTSTSEYKRLFLKVHNYLKQDVKITKGAIVESVYTIGSTKYSNVKKIHKAQEQLASENEDIIIGSSYAYRYYIPDEDTYNSSAYSNNIFINKNKEKISYKKALDISTSSVCYPDNTIHFTSAALSQIGKETAESLAINLDKISPEIQVKYSTIKETNGNVIVTITANEKIQKIEGWKLSDDGKTLSKTYTENTEEKISVYDLAGNSAQANVKIINIDKIAPDVKVTYSETGITNKDIEVKIIANEKIQEIEGWKLSEDKKTLSKTYTTNKSEKINVYDLAGNNSSVDIKVENIDKTAVNIETKYSTTRTTNEDVEVTIKANKKIQEIEGWKLSEDGKSLSKTYTENTEEKITVYDLAGNSAQANIKIINIDKIAPDVKVSYSKTEITNKDVEVKITANEKVQEIEGWELSEDKKTLSKTYTTNKSEKINVYDLAGNNSSVDIKVENIDKTVVNIETKYSTTKITNEDVEVTINANKKIQEIEGWKLSEDGKRLSKTYTENTEEKITVYDLAGNSTQTIIRIINIDKIVPDVKVSYSETEITNKDVEVKITANEKVREIEGWKLSEDEKTLSKIYTTNKSEKINVCDLAGNNISVDVKIENIDKTAVNIEMTYSTTKITNEDVEVTINANKKIQKIEGWKLSDDGKTLSKTYTENTEEKISVYDLAGNSAQANVKIINIDKIAPDVKVTYSETGITNKDIEVKIIANEKIQEIEGWKLSEDKKTLSKTYTTNKSEKVNVYDLAGNSIKVEVHVDNISKTEKNLPSKLPNAGVKSFCIILAIIGAGVLAIVFYKKSKI